MQQWNAVTFELARLVGTDGHVTGVDMDEVKLALGRASAVEQGLANVEFRGCQRQRLERG